MNIGNCRHLFFIRNQHDFILIFLILFHEVFDKGSRIVTGSVIHYDHSIVIVILIENRLQIEFVSEIFGVVEGRNDNAEGQLCCVSTHLIGGFQSVLFLFQLFLDSPLFHCIDEGGFNIKAFQDPGISSFFRFEVLPLHNFIEFCNLGLPYNFLRVILKKLEHYCLFLNLVL